MNNLQQNPSTSSPDTKGRVDTVYVTRVGDDNAYAFGTALGDGLAVFISGVVARKLTLVPGDRVEGLIVANLSQPSKSPWYLKHGRVVREVEKLETDITFLVGRLVDLGDAWKIEQIGEWLGVEDEVRGRTWAEAALETAHARGLVSKVILFRQGGGKTVWFTAVPDRVDVAEWDE